MTAHPEAQVAAPSELRPDSTPDLDRIVLKALAPEPANRYATAEELQLDLEELAREQKLKQSTVSLRAAGCPSPALLSASAAVKSMSAAVKPSCRNRGTSSVHARSMRRSRAFRDAGQSR